jgi:hypothetical protein
VAEGLTLVPFFIAFAYARMVPLFSNFFIEVPASRNLSMGQLVPNTMLTLTILAHLCELFTGIMPLVQLLH